MKLLLSLLFSYQAFGVGVSVRGGGDEVALEFLAEVNGVLQEIRERHPDLAPLVINLKPPTRDQILVSEEPLTIPIPGGVQDSIAVNEPHSGRIWVNRARWASVRSAPLRRAISLHEVASLRGLEGTGEYPISSAYLAKHLQNVDPEVIRLGRERLPFEPIRERVETNQTIKGLGAREVLTVGSKFTWIAKTFGYSMTYFHAYHSTEWELMGRPVLLQQWWKLLKQTKQGKVYRQWTRQISVDPKYGGVWARTQPHVVEFYLPLEDNGVVQAYDWKNGRRGAVLEQSEQVEFADGSVHSSIHKKGAKKARSKNSFDCVEALEGPGQTIDIKETEQMEREVSLLTVRARTAYDALVATGTWDSAEALAARERFEQMWETIFASQVKQANASARANFVRLELRKAREARLRRVQQP